ncbi:MAG: 1-acyl-sn-glycerol-3-phosphate acyltransferase [Bacteroidaceae bacterium]|nr:1-acyl-sn-glycerol-3-phosphate acyltransferase [Bacteroidaceae bacterium]
MIRFLCRKLLFGLLGWEEQVSVPRRAKCVIAVAPHTSNWDFIVGELYYAALGRHAGFLMKKDWFVGPLGALFRALGGIPVDRSRHGSMTDAIAQAAREADRFELAVTPEGTRKPVDRWKRGFYFIAQKAGLPIQLFAIDYRHKRIVCTREVVPSGDFERDWREIMDYYAQFEGCARRPGNFRVDNCEFSEGRG